MGTVLASTIIGRAQTLFVDTNATRWPTAECLDWLNAGQIEIVTMAPESFAVSGVLTLIAGTKQTTPANTIMLVRPVRNMGSDGATPGEPIRAISQKTMDSLRMTWHTDTPNSVTKNFMYDPGVRNTYFVHPPAVAGQKIEVVYVPLPTNVGSSGSAITLDDFYQNALLDYIMYRGFSKDIELPGAPSKAAEFYQLFRQGIGVGEKPLAAVAEKEPQ
jgi:hypothetical protein